MRKIKLGSLFDGSGGFPLGGILAGIEPIWASEIEPFPIRVTTKRLPFVKHYGDVNLLRGDEIEPVDIITFGSPCTDLSIAGKREGLEGKQSGLFHQAIRVIKEMRHKTNGKNPSYIVFENVPGAFSSNKGEDFRVVLEEICQICVPKISVPGFKGWMQDGCIMGDGFSVAWRIFEADAWGVPQRRKRIYLVGHLTGDRAGKVLFESEGVSGYSAEGFRAWQRTACYTEGRAAETGGAVCLNDQGGIRMDVTHEVAATLRAEARHPPLVMRSAGFCTEHSADARSIGYEEEKAPTLRAGIVPAAVFENHGQDHRFSGPVEKAPTVSSTYGTGGNNQPFVVHQEVFGISPKDSNSMKSANPHSGIYKAETSRTLDAQGGNPTCNQGGIAIVETVKTYDIRQSSDGTANMRNHAYESDTSRTVDRGGNMPGSNQGGIAVVSIKEPTYCASKNSHFTRAIKEKTGSLVATDYKDPPFVNVDYAVRRLTPTECARLQGFPDWWCADLETQDPTEEEIQFWTEVFETHRRVMGKTKSKTRKQIIKWLQDPHTDSAEYKMWGNGVALPCVYFVLAGIEYFFDE